MIDSKRDLTNALLKIDQLATSLGKNLQKNSKHARILIFQNVGFFVPFVNFLYLVFVFPRFHPAGFDLIH